jgi:hypothetical protein
MRALVLSTEGEQLEEHEWRTQQAFLLAAPFGKVPQLIDGLFADRHHGRSKAQRQ